MNPQTFSLLLFAVFGYVAVVECCKFNLHVKSTTKVPFQFEVLIPSLKQKTEKATFFGQGEKKVHISGGDCMKQKMVFKTYKLVNGQWIGAAQTSARLGGNGKFLAVVGDDLMPMGSSRHGIACSEGSFCG